MTITPLAAYRATQNIAGIPAPQTAEAQALWQACQEFEALFASQLLRAMSSTLSGGMFGTSAGSDFYQEMYNSEMAKAMSKSGSLGLASMLYRQIENKQ